MNILEGLIGAGLMVGITMLTGTAHGEDKLPPSDMVYVGHGPSVMGLDKAQTADSGRRLTAYDKRMKKPWSAEAFHDEGPAHMVFLDAFLIDKYEVANKDYGDFIRATGHPAPAYWDDPRLNKPQQPVVGVNWYDAKAYCESRGEAAADGSRMGEGGSWSTRQPLSLGQRFRFGKSQLQPASGCDLAGGLAPGRGQLLWPV